MLQMWLAVQLITPALMVTFWLDMQTWNTLIFTP